ncbi:MAG: hypothetical protein QNJ94_10570 [Alphaproteobacteria bacterium]|nr:hypothetical protein [Alphaproteobacteria bacterium]
MKRTSVLTACVAALLLAGCGAFYPTESRVVSKNWVSAPFAAQFNRNLPPDNTPVPTCYNTIGVVECHYHSLPRREAGRVVNSYTGARPRVEEPEPEEKPKPEEEHGRTVSQQGLKSNGAKKGPQKSATVPRPVPVVQVPRRKTAEPTKIIQ